MEQPETIWQKIYRKKWHHAILWIAYFFFWCFVYRDYYASWIPLVEATGIYVIFNATAFYTTAYYLIPRFLYRRRIIMFLLLASVLMVVVSVMHAAALYPFAHDPKSFLANFRYILLGTFSSNVLYTSLLCAVKAFLERMRHERARLKSELQYLKAQVNPHFLFNTINSVYFLIKKNPDQAAETLIKLSDLLRFQLYDCADEKIPIEKELAYVDNYIALEQIRKGDKVTVEMVTEGGLSGFLIEPFLLIPFLENAFKFVSNFGDRPNTIRVHVQRNGHLFSASFTNTFEDDTPRNAVGGIGLRNVKRRLELLYPGKHILDLNSQAGMYTANLTIHLT